MSRPLSREAKLYALRRATGGFATAGNRWEERARTGLTDDQLEEALRFEIGNGRLMRAERTATLPEPGCDCQPIETTLP